MEKKEYKKPTLEVILTEMGPVLAVISPGQDGERPAPPMIEFDDDFDDFDEEGEDSI